jgi:hypothetical protein
MFQDLLESGGKNPLVTGTWSPGKIAVRATQSDLPGLREFKEFDIVIALGNDLGIALRTFDAHIAISPGTSSSIAILPAG